MISLTKEARGQASGRRNVMLFTILSLAGLMAPQVSDTLAAVTVSADRGVVVSRADTVSFHNSISVSEALMQSPGVIINDNGGFAGLKTLNLRGLGSPHTSISIDGVRVGNVQSGQPDLGMFDTGSFGAAVIDYAQNSVNFNTARPVFSDRAVSGKVAFSGGSYGTYLPSAVLNFRLGDRLSMRTSASGTFSKGNYLLEDGSRRVNNDISQVRGGVDLFGLAAGGDWMTKLYLNWAERGTPGSVDWPSSDRQKDWNAFAQGVLRKNFNALYSLNLSARVAYDKVYYFSEWGDSDYAQTEAQINSTHKFRVNSWLSFSQVANAQLDWLNSSLYGALRADLVEISGVSFTPGKFKSDITLQFEAVLDRGGMHVGVLSPSIDLKYEILTGLAVSAFARRAYRAPTFNELYYPGYGNPELRPEDAWLSDLGLEWHGGRGGWKFSSKADGFFNYLTDKIVSAPSEENPSLWMPYNIETVCSAGLDALAGVEYVSGNWRTSLEARYSFQYVENVPYLSRHTAVVSADASVSGWTLDLLWNYRGGRTDANGPMPDWNTLDVHLGKCFKIGRYDELIIRFSCRNAAGCRYELVSGYPMPGRSFIGGIEYKF